MLGLEFNYRQGKSNRCAFSALAFYAYLTLVSRNNVAADGKAVAGAAVLAVNAALKHTGQKLRCYAGTCVAYFGF